MKKKGTTNLTFTQRNQIETLFNANHSKQYIADFVGVSLRTIQRELKRGEYEHTQRIPNFWKGDKYKKVKRYSAHIAQQRYDFLSTSKGRPLKIGSDFELVRYIEKRVNEDKISACAVLGEIKRRNMPFKTQISKTTLYRYIEIGIFSNLKIGRYVKHPYRKVMKKAPRGTSIEKRPLEINQRINFGHWEMDCICGCNKCVWLVLTERLTRKEIIFKMDSQTAVNVVKCLNTLEHKFGKRFKQIFKSITVDNGSEFSDFRGMEKSIYGKNNKRTIVYYCHPYRSCERGSNERLNREIRKLVPKGSDLSKYSTEDVQKIEDWVNNYPRQVLDYATSGELFNIHLQLIS